MRVLSRLFRRLFLEKLTAAHQAGHLHFFGEHFALGAHKDFLAFVKPLRNIEWVVYAKRPFAGPDAVLAYLSRYTHRVAIANSRLIACNDRGVTFKWKDYRKPAPAQHTTMTLTIDEFIRRFLLHVQPRGFHRIRHYGLLANHQRANALGHARELLNCETPTPASHSSSEHERAPTFVCPACGRPMRVVEQFQRGHAVRAIPFATGPPCVA